MNQPNTDCRGRFEHIIPECANCPGTYEYMVNCHAYDPVEVNPYWFENGEHKRTFPRFHGKGWRK